MNENEPKKKKKLIYVLFPIFVIASIIELVILLNQSNKELQSIPKENKKEEKIEKNGEKELTFGDTSILFDSANVSYDNSTSGLSSTTVKTAIDELYGAANSCVTSLGTCNSDKSSCQSSLSTAQSNYSTCSSSLSTCNSNYSTCSSSLSTAQSNYSTCSSSLSTCQSNLANAPIAKNNTVYYAFGTPTTSSATNYTTLNKKVFVALNGSQKSVCIIRNSKLHCFDNNNWPIEKDHIQQVFSDISCDVTSSRVRCDASDFSCYVSSNGSVDCAANQADEHCIVSGGGSVKCS